MAEKIVKGKIANALTSVAMNHIVATTEDIFDENLQKYQQDINEFVTSVIPSGTTNENQLVNKEYVDNEILHSAAYFRGTFETWDDVPENPDGYNDDRLNNRIPSKNDYIIIKDCSTYPNEKLLKVWRFKYIGLWEENGKNGWVPEYQVEEATIKNISWKITPIKKLPYYPAKGSVNEVVTVKNELYKSVEYPKISLNLSNITGKTDDVTDNEILNIINKNGILINNTIQDEYSIIDFSNTKYFTDGGIVLDEDKKLLFCPRRDEKTNNNLYITKVIIEAKPLYDHTTNVAENNSELFCYLDDGNGNYYSNTFTIKKNRFRYKQNITKIEIECKEPLNYFYIKCNKYSSIITNIEIDLIVKDSENNFYTPLVWKQVTENDLTIYSTELLPNDETKKSFYRTPNNVLNVVDEVNGGYSWNKVVKHTDISKVGFTGEYNDLINKPNLGIQLFELPDNEKLPFIDETYKNLLIKWKKHIFMPVYDDKGYFLDFSDFSAWAYENSFQQGLVLNGTELLKYIFSKDTNFDHYENHYCEFTNCNVKSSYDFGLEVGDMNLILNNGLTFNSVTITIQPYFFNDEGDNRTYGDLSTANGVLTTEIGKTTENGDFELLHSFNHSFNEGDSIETFTFTLNGENSNTLKFKTEESTKCIINSIKFNGFKLNNEQLNFYKHWKQIDYSGIKFIDLT